MSTYVNARCHCGLNKFKITFLTASLPITTDMCHCNACKHSSGQLGYHVVAFHGAPLAPTPDSDVPADLTTLSRYQTNPKATRYFCGTCSAHLFWKTNGEEHWSVATGALERTDGIVKLGFHIFIGDTCDGGLAEVYRTFAGGDLARYKVAEGSETVPLAWKSIDPKDDGHGAANERLDLYCHCKANTFHITRATACTNPEKEWWLRPGAEGEPIKFYASHCVCTSCRLTSGQEIQSWVILPRENIIDPATGVPINFRDTGKRPKGLRQYASTPADEIYREFCGTCGASMFYWLSERDIVDVSAGVLDQDTWGARAEHWLKWDKKVIHSEDAINPGMLEALKQGVEGAQY